MAQLSGTNLLRIGLLISSVCTPLLLVKITVLGPEQSKHFKLIGKSVRTGEALERESPFGNGSLWN